MYHKASLFPSVSLNPSQAFIFHHFAVLFFLPSELSSKVHLPPQPLCGTGKHLCHSPTSKSLTTTSPCFPVPPTGFTVKCRQALLSKSFPGVTQFVKNITFRCVFSVFFLFGTQTNQESCYCVKFIFYRDTWLQFQCASLVLLSHKNTKKTINWSHIFAILTAPFNDFSKHTGDESNSTKSKHAEKKWEKGKVPGRVGPLKAWSWRAYSCSQPPHLDRHKKDLVTENMTKIHMTSSAFTNDSFKYSTSRRQSHS